MEQGVPSKPNKMPQRVPGPPIALFE